MIFLDKNSSSPFYAQIYGQFAAHIEDGTLQAGAQLPSIRQLSNTLGTSINTVKRAYLQLVEHGYADAHPGSGYTVNSYTGVPVRSTRFSSSYERSLSELMRYPAEREWLYDFGLESIDPDFSPAIWAKYSRDVVLDEKAGGFAHPVEMRGLAELRLQIAAAIERECGIRALPEQILVTPGIHACIHSILTLLELKNGVVAVQQPSPNSLRNVFAARGLQTKPWRVSETRNRPGGGPAVPGAKLYICSPACLYPACSCLSIEQRTSLARMIEHTDAYLIEDLYCSEFRTGKLRAPAIHMLEDTGRVIAVGSFARTISPSLAIAFAILPPQLMLRALEKHGTQASRVSWQAQATCARFLERGSWSEQVKRQRTMLVRKLDQLQQSVDAHMGERVHMHSSPGAPHVLVQTADGTDAEELVRRAAQAGIRVISTARDWTGGAPQSWRYVALGFAGTPIESIDEGIAALANAWFE